jgi:hypothetical protein
MMRRLLLIVAVLNVAGLACFYTTAHAHDPLAGRHLADPVYVLDSVGFTLMLPGIFFAAIAFMCARAFAWSDETARAIWYATGFIINLFIAWKVGHAFAGGHADVK